MTSVRELIVLNNDTLVCEDCYELNAPPETTPDVDPGLWPMARVAVGECSNCGYLPVPNVTEQQLEDLRGSVRDGLSLGEAAEWVSRHWPALEAALSGPNVTDEMVDFVLEPLYARHQLVGQDYADARAALEAALEGEQ